MTVLARFLEDRRRAMFWWCVAMIGLVLFTLAFYPVIEGDPELDDLVEDLPQAIRAMLGVEEGVSLTSAPGFLHARLFSTLLPIILLVFGIGVGAAAIGGSEDDGTLELLLSNPVSRLRVLLERYAAMVLLLAALTAVFALALLALAPLFDALEGVSVGGLLGAAAAAGCLALLHASIAFAVGSATGRRSPAIGVATAVAAAGYLSYGLLSVTQDLEPLRYATPWYWYLEQNMLVHGPTALSILAPLAASAALAAASVPLFTRRDLR